VQFKGVAKRNGVYLHIVFAGDVPTKTADIQFLAL